MLNTGHVCGARNQGVLFRALSGENIRGEKRFDIVLGEEAVCRVRVRAGQARSIG